MDSPRSRLEAALREAEPRRAVHELARALRDEGMTQADLYELFREFHAIHKRDPDETLSDAILDTLDFISGWCRPGARLYDTTLPPNV